MASTKAVALLLVASCVVVGAFASDDYNYISLNLQWPFTSGCSDNCKPMFTIHGMWPSVGTSGPSFCGGQFDPNVLEPILSELQTAWPSYQGEDDSFWSHEWLKHGTCAMEGGAPGMGSEFDFFNTTLTIWTNLDIMRTLKASNIVPSNDQTYKVSDMVDALKSKFGYAPVFGCSDEKINTLAICFSKDLKLDECPSDLYGCDADSYVKLPSSSYSVKSRV